MHLIKEQEWKKLPEQHSKKSMTFLYLKNSVMVNPLLAKKAKALSLSQIIVRIP